MPRPSQGVAFFVSGAACLRSVHHRYLWYHHLKVRFLRALQTARKLQQSRRAPYQRPACPSSGLYPESRWDGPECCCSDLIPVKANSYPLCHLHYSRCSLKTMLTCQDNVQTCNLTPSTDAIGVWQLIHTLFRHKLLHCNRCQTSSNRLQLIGLRLTFILACSCAGLLGQTQ